jgi:hypothetical protein
MHLILYFFIEIVNNSVGEQERVHRECWSRDD